MTENAVTLAQALQIAIQHHNAGQLQQAEILYRQILQVEPDHPDALHLLGVLALQVGQPDAAIELIGKALGKLPDNPDFLNNYAEACRLARRFAEAAAALQRALALRPNFPEGHNNLGNVYKEQGERAAAQACYREALALRPVYPEALSNLGTALLDEGKVTQASECYRQALAQRPDYPEAAYNLGNSLKAEGWLDEAAAAYRRALALRPAYPEAQLNLGSVFLEQVNLAGAQACFESALALKPDYPVAWNNLGNVRHDQGQLDEAVACYRRAVAVAPDFADAWLNLGRTLREQECREEALQCWLNALALKPDLAEACLSLGSLLKDMARIDEAVGYLRRALVLRPDYPEAWNNLGVALKENGYFDEAIACYRRAIVSRQDFAEAHSNLGTLLHERNFFDEALFSLEQALRLAPDLAQAHNNLGNLLKDTGDLRGALAAYRRALELEPNYGDAHSNLLLAAQHAEFISEAELFAEHRRFGSHFPVPQRDWPNSRDPERRLRIGYVSPDFRRHSVAFFVEPLFAHHDKAHFEIHVYYNHLQHDKVTERLAAFADHWTVCKGVSDDQLAERIRADGIDILIDLSGHTAGNRLPVFARKPASLQAGWLGYNGTTGLEAMDYRLVDAYTDPEGLSEGYNSERLYRLPGCFVTYRPPEGCPDVVAPPCLRNGYVTFGSFNNFAKLTPETMEVWAALLKHVPNSRLLLKAAVFESPQQQVRVTAVFADLGVESARLTLVGRDPDDFGHFARYGEIDIGLDPFPYNGVTTTCEALWMGVPVVNLAGRRSGGRIGITLLENAGMPELIAATTASYLELAASLAGNPDRLVELRAAMRGRLMNSPLMDAPRFTRDLEAAYRQMWREYCVREKQD